MSMDKTPSLPTGASPLAARSEDRAATGQVPALRPDPLQPNDRARFAWLANKRQELLAPANAIVELNEILVHDARERGQERFVYDMEQIQTSGRHLLAIVQKLLDPANLPLEETAFAGRVRHDVRTPLTYIMGLCELWLEDAADLLIEGFVNDLSQIHKLSEKLLVSIDALLGFGKMEAIPEIDQEATIRTMLESLVPAPEAKAPIARCRVLVVDDNEINRDILQRRRVGQAAKR